MDGGSRDPRAGRDESPCGAGGVHGWDNPSDRHGHTVRTLAQRRTVTLGLPMRVACSLWARLLSPVALTSGLSPPRAPFLPSLGRSPPHPRLTVTTVSASR